MTTETALSPAPEAPTSGQPDNAEQLDTQTEHASESPDSDGEQKQEEKKPEKTEAERERDRLRKAIDRRTRREAEARAEAAQLRAELERLRAIEPQSKRLRASESGDTNDADADEPLTLSRAELAQMVKSEAERLAPTLKQQQAEIEHRKKVIEGLAKELGQERFDALAEDLDEALGGLHRNGKPTAATEAIFAADDPQAVIQYLADPENADEAEAIGRMDPIRAGRAIAKLETKLEKVKAKDKPQRSNAPEPVEPTRPSGGASAEPDTSKWTDAQWIKWRQSNRK